MMLGVQLSHVEEGQWFPHFPRAVGALLEAVFSLRQRRSSQL